MTRAAPARPAEAVGVREAADLYRVGEKTILRAIKSGALKAKRPGREYRIAIDALRSWFASLDDANVT